MISTIRKFHHAVLLSVIFCSLIIKATGLHFENPSLVSINNSHKYGQIKSEIDHVLRKQKKRGVLSENRVNTGGIKDLTLESSLTVSGGDSLAGATKNKNTGRLLLIFVAFLYGSLNVVFRLVYAMPDPPSASALSFTRGWLAAASFLPILFTNRGSNYQIEEKTPEENSAPFWKAVASVLSLNWLPAVPFVPVLFANRNRNNQTKEKSSEDSSVETPLWKAALELAFWNFGAQGLLNIGLLFTDAARASFLTQSSVVMTPIISIFAGQQVPRIVWAGCLSALAGLIMLSGAGDGGSGPALAFSTGDLLVLGGALSWSMYIFRITTVGKRYPEIPLQSIKTTLLAVLYSVWFLASAVKVLVSGSSLTTLWPGWTNLGAWLMLLYSAVGPGAIADVLQQIGQKEVSASEANVILSSEPIFTAVCARLILGEITSKTENIGGALIIIGALLASGA